MFLVPCTRLNNPLCPSVCPSLCPLSLCRTQGDLRCLFVYSFVRSFFHLSVSPPPHLRLKSQPWDSNPSLESPPEGSNLHTQMDGWTNKQTNESPPVFYKTSTPLGPLPCYQSPTITNIYSRAMSIADHVLPLGDWFTSLAFAGYF